MLVEGTALTGVLVLAPARHGDALGVVSESCNWRTLEARVDLLPFVQNTVQDRLKRTVTWYLGNEAWWRLLLDRKGVGQRLGTI